MKLLEEERDKAEREKFVLFKKNIYDYMILVLTHWDAAQWCEPVQTDNMKLFQLFSSNPQH